MGFKGYRLWVMGQLDSNVRSPAARLNTHPPGIISTSTCCSRDVGGTS
jgi:hypothetical protein